MLNNCSINGRLVDDGELRYTANGMAVFNITLAVQRNRKNDNGDYDADFIDCVIFGTRAEFLSKNIAKGCRIGVTGRIQSRTWEDKKGNTRKNTEIIANDVDIIDWDKAKSKKQEDSIDVPF